MADCFGNVLNEVKSASVNPDLRRVSAFGEKGRQWSFQRYCLQREWLCNVSGHYVGTARGAEASGLTEKALPGINRGRSGTRNLIGWAEPLSRAYNLSEAERKVRIVQELCESRGGRPGLSVLTSLLVSVDVKL